ncbi:MAG: RNA-binding protein [Candidatus Aenigmatarchaeota archaeon]|nr:MAG: RNA-binding protein [Candidatus Aenigmarchaeota archaeon]
MKERRCVTCGKKIESEAEWVECNCPKCGKERIIRCSKCKKLMNPYECPKCGFVGP